MPSLTQRLDAFQRMRPAARRIGLTDALRYAEPAEITPLVHELAANPTTEGYLLLLSRYYQIDNAARHKILQGGMNLSAALMQALHGDEPQLRQTALQLIEIREDKRCVAALAAPFERTDETVENLALAARILRTFAQLLTKSVIPDPADRLAFEQLDAAVVKALETYPIHRQAELLLAAALLTKMPGRAMTAFLADHDHPAHFALRGVLKKFGDEFVAESALEWLNLDQLAPQLYDRVAQLARTRHLGAILQSVHLVQLPRVEARLQRLNSRYPSSLPLGQAAEFLDGEMLANLPAWVRAIPMSLPNRVAYLGEGLCFEEPRARLAALRALIGLRAAEADAMVESFCFDEDETIARIATRHCLRIHARADKYGEMRPLFARLAGSPHASVRELSAELNRIEDFDAWWALSLQIEQSGGGRADETDGIRARSEFLESMRAEQTLGMCFLRSYCRKELAEGLRSKLLSADRVVRKRTVALVRQFDLADFVELELLALAAEDDPQITSEIITTISGIRSEAAHDILWLALRHPNNRVRANAIEALQYRADLVIADWQTVLGERVISNDNRIRANAVRALHLINPTEATHQLKAMLGDARPLHRISGLWASARTGQLGCAEEVADLAEADEMQPIRARAQRTAARLLGRLAAMRLAQERPVALGASVSESEGHLDDLQQFGSHEIALPVQLLPNTAVRKPLSALTTTMTIILTTGLTAVLSYAQGQNNPVDGNGRGRLAEISDAFTGRGLNAEATPAPEIGWAWLSWLVGGAVLIALVAFAYKLQRLDHERFGPDYRLFAAALRLNYFDMFVVHAMARAVGSANGIGLLISAGSFQHHLDVCVETGSTMQRLFLKGLIRARVTGIRAQLFG